MQLCETSQIGRVGNIKEVGKNLMISVASDRGFKRDGEWIDKTNWIEYTVFGREEKRIEWLKANLKKGDLVYVRATPGQTSWKDKDGETRYGFTFAVDDLRIEASAPDKADDGKAKKTRK